MSIEVCIIPILFVGSQCVSIEVRIKCPSGKRASRGKHHRGLSACRTTRSYETIGVSVIIIKRNNNYTIYILGYEVVQCFLFLVWGQRPQVAIFQGWLYLSIVFVEVPII